MASSSPTSLPVPQPVTGAACPYACADRGVHCPTADPLEALMADRQRDHWVPYWDETEARLVYETRCAACDGCLIYVALAPPDSALGTAWALCSACRHWVAL